ncbi:PCRF domain-containing protein [Candidatus Parcubacteria bacterium]|nr:PCRF domain-containing protein [Candidatus Parcubacteria bacterium]
MIESLILEIRAGVGGEEAALFARDLFRMYTKYAQKKGWKVTIWDIKESDLGGIKEATLEIKGENAFEALKYEGGVHRVQRIPKTEKSGRIHTSTATVAVLKKPKESEIKIHPNELKFEFFKASGPGGQYVNKRMTAVRVIHLPTNIIVTCQTERSLQQNKEAAIEILKAKLFELKEKEKQEAILKERRGQIGFGERAEKMRTYNFLQNRVTDHRIKKSWHKLEEILDGDLDPIISELQKKLQ